MIILKYTVKVGDTLWGISNQFGVSVTELASLNNVDAKNLKVGQVLTIPSNVGVNPDNMFLYTVKKGDSLYSISKVYGTTVPAIKNLNYLTNDSLVIGQVIRIPEVYTKPDEMVIPEYVNYIVKKGDSLYSIARSYEIDVSTLMKDNALSSSTLKVGQNLKIRVPKGSLEVEECFGEDYNGSIPKSFEYIVSKGDTLYSIAKKYGVSVSDLINYNKLINNSLSIGQVLKIPSNTIQYRVIKGDTLYSIARKFNTSVDVIKKKNSLAQNSLSIGQVLYI